MSANESYYASAPITASGTIPAKELQGIFCSSSTAGTLVIYDGTTASGTLVVSVFTLVAGTFYRIPFRTLTGNLYFTVGGTTSFTAFTA